MVLGNANFVFFWCITQTLRDSTKFNFKVVWTKMLLVISVSLIENLSLS